VAAERLGRRGPAVADRVVTEVFSTLTERQRHLLLCLGAEQAVTVPTAERLTHDPRAGELLADLEATGLLVTRSGGAGPRAAADPADQTGEDESPAVFKIHPLLAEVTRRRLVAGGVDVSRARGAVLRAVHLDLARGEIAPSFRRLVAYGEVREAADVLAEHGLALQLGGHGVAIRRFARAYPTEIDEHPGTWFSVAYERWVAGDVTGACRWMDRIVTSRRVAGEEPGAEAACIGLLRSRLGVESASAALERARRAVAAEHSASASSPVLTLLLLELGITENWLGQLAQAEVHLSAAALACRHEALTGLRAEALSHLVFTEYMLGRPHVGVDLAEESLQILAAAPWQPSTTTARVMVALELIQIEDLPWPTAPLQPTPRRYPVHEADLTTKFWAHLLTARRSLACGSVVEAEHVLDVPVETPSVPRHLRIAALIARAMAAGLATDRDRLRKLAQDLGALDAPAEAAFVAGILADLVGDQHRADELWRRTTTAGEAAQPGVVPMALACRAQLVDALGRHDEADRLLAAAALATEVTRYAVPFLGWSRSGTPMPTLLERLEAARPTDWVRDLAAASAQHLGLGAFFGPVTATAQERAHAAAPVVAPLLSPRERDVLHELARGSTYADIAANLIVSENTVKTHVSSLYAKLAVSRRSEALAVARTSHLL
jgi:DNA-binding CsgD family transcriptional regulator